MCLPATNRQAFHTFTATCIFPPEMPYYPRGDHIEKDKEEKLNQKKSNEMFNSITEKVKPENQNQTHNSRREGMGPNTKRRPC